MKRFSLQSADARKTRVVIVDDSSVVRGFIARWLSSCDDVELVGSAANGLEAVALIPAIRPDVVILDIEMPQMNGLEALPLIRIGAPNAAIIISSRLTRKNAELALRCLAAGATEILPKPVSDSNLASLREFQRELLDMVRSLGRRDGPMRRAPTVRDEATKEIAPTAKDNVAAAKTQQQQPAPRAPRARHVFEAPRIILVGASTGGPNACSELVRALKPLIARLPVVIAQHMPPVFTRVFAEHLARSTGVPCHEAKDGDAARPGHVAIAPGGRHITLFGSADEPRLQVDDRPPLRFSRPSVDLLFESAHAVFGGRAIGIVLTGMGSDGLEGARLLAGAGARICAQDEDSSIVWGMPGAVARAGVAHDVLAPAAIGAALCSSLIAGAK